MELNSIKNAVTANQAAQQAQQTQAAREARTPVQEKPVEPGAKPEFHQEPDQYSPKEPEGNPGLYWMEPGENGPKVNYSSPEEEKSTDTDEVDREIERLKQKVEDLEQRLGGAQGPERERLERQLKQAQSQLDKKDNDAYRRAHAKIS